MKQKLEVEINNFYKTVLAEKLLFLKCDFNRRADTRRGCLLMCLTVCFLLCVHFFTYVLVCSLSKKLDTEYIQHMCLSTCLHADTQLLYIYYRFVYAYVCVCGQ